MDRFDVVKFDDLTGPGGEEWIKIGGGSFGVVFRGEYLGTEVAIKEVLPNNSYDVEKYFERECVLMKEARHPNIVQYIGLTKSPGLNGRIYIISEFVGGNLRSFIADKKKPFSWPLRVNFATDIARAVAYLHARNCLHRDLKGENLLITANNRIKVCDFGFARIAARNEEEMRRISYCGTDGYMSPEILMGVDFSLPSDIFSLGVIFCEIISRQLVDSNHFKRQMPTFGLEENEVRELASIGCPADFIQLCLDCCKVDPLERPDMRQIVKRLRLIEQQVMQEEMKKGTVDNVGSLRGSSLHAILGNNKSKKNGGGRPKAPRLPSFEGKIKLRHSIREESPDQSTSSEESSDEDMEEALKALENVNIGLTGDEQRASKMALDSIKMASTFKVSGHGNPWWDEDSSNSIDIPQSWVKDMSLDQISPKSCSKIQETREEEYSTTVVRPSKNIANRAHLAATLSKMSSANDMDTDSPEGSNVTVRHRAPLVNADDTINTQNSHLEGHCRAGELSEAVTLKPSEVVMHTCAADSDEVAITQSFMTARSQHHNHQHHHHHHPYGHDPSLAMATIASSIYEPALLYHRFTLIKNGMKRPTSIHQTIEDSMSSSPSSSSSSSGWGGSLIPPQLILANALTKCNVCNKRLGFGAYMDCDDCPYKTHVGCAAMAEPTCQEMNIPNSNGNNTPILTPYHASRKILSPDGPTTPPTAAAALARAVQGHPSPSPMLTSSKKEKDAKSPPNSVSRGVNNLFRRRNSKSPPPAVTPSSVKV